MKRLECSVLCILTGMCVGQMFKYHNSGNGEAAFGFVTAAIFGALLLANLLFSPSPTPCPRCESEGSTRLKAQAASEVSPLVASNSGIQGVLEKIRTRECRSVAGANQISDTIDKLKDVPPGVAVRLDRPKEALLSACDPRVNIYPSDSALKCEQPSKTV